LIEGDFKKAYDLAQTVIHIESASGRKGIASPYDCKFVMLRCQFELGLLEQAEILIAEFREEVVHNKFDSLLFLCEASLIRIMARDVNRLPDAFKKVEHLQDLLAKNPNFSEMSWLVDMCELFVRVSSKDIARAKVLLNRNQHIPYVQLLNSSKLRFITEEELQTVQALPENTPFEIMNKYISLAKFQIIGSKKQEKFLEVALKVGEKSGALEIFLRQPNSVLESIIKIANDSSSQWLESLSRSAIARIKEREGQASFGGEQLTKREIEILKYLASGKSIEEIGSALHISKNTMKTHLKNVYRKLKVKDRKEASELAKNKLLV
jgi:ATP/maltotriose-dependent transcriptional regulator MalT